MKILKKLFRKKPPNRLTVEENMMKMASLGVPFESILSYQESAAKIKAFEEKLKKDTHF